MGEMLSGDPEETRRLINELTAKEEMEPGIESKINFEMYERSLTDGIADEYLETVGMLPAEALLEEQQDERVWEELSQEERKAVYNLLKWYADIHGYSIEIDDCSCMVLPA